MPIQKQNITILTLTLFLAGGILLYGNIINGFFLSDDFYFIYLASKGGPFAFWTGKGAVFFRPLIALSFYIDYQLFGLNPTGYHLTNLLFHSASAWFVYLIAGLQFRESKSVLEPELASFIAGVFFLALPSHAEPVSWISGRTDVIAAFFGLGSFYLFQKFQRTSTRLLLVMSLISFMLALLAKESVLTLPLIVLIYQYINKRWIEKEQVQIIHLLDALGFWFMLGLYFVGRFLLTGNLLRGYGLGVHLAGTNLTILPLAVLRVFLPPLPFLGTLTNSVPVWLAILVLALALMLIGLLLMRRKQHPMSIPNSDTPMLVFLFLAFCIGLLPGLSLIHIRTMLASLGERALYFASAFSSIICGYALWPLLRQKRQVLFAAVSLIMYFSIALYSSNANHKNAGKISQAMIASFEAPNVEESYVILGVPAFYRGVHMFGDEALWAAMQLFSSVDESAEFLPITLTYLFDKNDTVTIKMQTPGRYLVRATNPSQYSWLWGLTDPQFQMTNKGLSNLAGTLWGRELINSYEITIPEQISVDQIYYYSEGQLLPLVSEQ